MSAQKLPAKRVIPGELALLCGLVLNSFAVSMYIQADFGLTVVSGLPYLLSIIIPKISYGMLNAAVQSAWLLLLMVVLRRFRPGYVLSFALSFVFGFMINGFRAVLAPLPVTIPFRLLWFALGFAAMSTGIPLMIRCGLPILPFDAVPREFVVLRGISIQKARTAFDITNLTLMLALGLIFLRRVEAIGPGSLVLALCMGTTSGFVASKLDKRFVIQPWCGALARLA